MIAGSIFNVFAAMGSTHPIVLAATTVQKRLKTTVRQIIVFPGYWSIRRIKLTRDKTTPTSTPTRTSFQTTLKISVTAISPTAIPRMIMVLLWLPQFPPVSINIGTKLTRRGTAANAFSYFNRIPPVMVLESIKIKSQGIRFFASWNTPVFR